MRTYHMELRSTGTYGVGLVAVSAKTSSLRCAVRTPRRRRPSRWRARVDLANVNFRYAVGGDRAPWRPLRADDGRQVFIEFPRGIGQGEMPPLFVVGPEGNTSELVNYRVRQYPHDR
jgi:type IV secretion system protein VirB9